MALRTLIRLLALALASIPVSALLWEQVGVLPILAGFGLLGLTFGYLALLAGGGELTRWQVRYHLEEVSDLDHLEAVLRFLADRTGHYVVEASAQGLLLELPPALDRYVQAQLPRVLPEVRLTRCDRDYVSQVMRSSFFSVGLLTSQVLRWATEGEGRQVRVHAHPGPTVTATAQTNGARPPGRWMRVSIRRPLARLWHRLPVWDELSAGARISGLLPPTDDACLYSSRSRLVCLAPPDGYEPDLTERHLGQSVDSRPLTMRYEVPLFTVGAPASFLTDQVLGDLEAGRAVVVVSPHRRLLERMARQATGATVYWLDPQCSWRSAHLPIVRPDEWQEQDVEGTVEALLTFLADLDVNVSLPAIGGFSRRLLQALVTSTRQAQRDLAFSDLYAVSQGTQALRTFLARQPDLGSELLAQLDTDGGYVQAVTVLAAIRTVLQPLEAGPLHSLCQPPFLNLAQALREGSLVLVPMTDADFPEHDRLLGAILDLALQRAVANGDEMRIAVHLHDPHLYRPDQGQRWINAARRDPQVSLLLDVQDPDSYTSRHEGQIIFRCSDALAPSIIQAWDLPASAADLTALPPGIGIARLPGMVVTLKVSQR